MSNNTNDGQKRLNYLYQISHFILEKDSNDDNNILDMNHTLSRYYIHTMKSVAQKKVQRLTHDIKNSTCKECNTLLIPGKTCHIKKTKKPYASVKKICHFCQKSIKEYVYPHSNLIKREEIISE